MTTSQYVSWLIKRIAGNLFSRTDLVDAINQAQNEILGRDIRYMRIFPDPFFHTTSGTYEYTASTALYNSIDGTTQYDIRNVSRVFAFNIRSSPIFAYGGINRSTQKPEELVNPLSSDETNIPADCLQSIAANSSDCKIRLWRENNPGTNTTLYMAEAYRWPTQVTSESVALTIPDQFQRGLLKYAVLKDIEYTEYGSAKSPEELYAQEIRKFDLWANRGANTDPTSTPFREC